MRTLTIECSTGQGSIALSEDQRLLRTRSFENPRGQGTEFFAALEDECAYCDDLDLVLIGTGPGSYNALRTSIGAAWGIARARRVPLRGLCSLLGYDASEYHVLGDARAGQWFHAHISNGRFLSAPTLFGPAEAVAQITPGTPVFTTAPLLESACFESPVASQLMRYADQAGAAEPIYLKPPHITKPSCKP